MAAVTQNAPAERHVIGDLAYRVFNVSGASLSTLDTGMRQIKFVDIQQSTAAGSISLITAFSVNQTTGVITFTSSAPMVTEIVAVTARVG